MNANLCLFYSTSSHLISFRNEKNYDYLVTKCAQSTSRRRWTVFGLQYYGECWSGENAPNTYSKSGETDRCTISGVSGVGTVNDNYVYGLLE